MARPPSAAYKFQKAWRRNKVVYSAGVAVVAALLVGIGISSWQTVIAIRAKQEAVSAEQEREREAQNAREESENAKQQKGRAPSWEEIAAAEAKEKRP